MRKAISLLIRICISAGILFFLLKCVDTENIIQSALHINKPILILVLLLTLLIYFVGFLRWRMLLVGLGLSVSWFLIFRSFCIGYFFNLFFPSTIGGDLIRGIDLGLRIQNAKRVAASLILDRISGYSALVCVCLLALLLGRRIITDAAIFIALGIILLILAVILALLFNKFLFARCSKFLRFFGRAGQALSNLHYEIYNFRNQKGIIIKNLAYSLVVQSIMPVTFYLITLALGVKIRPIYFFILVPIITAVSALPFSVAGLGLREAGSMYFFTKVGMSAETALTVALLSFAIIFLFGLAGGIIYVFTFSYRRL
jgi:uncharacterized protein (TIRG00374 family)